MDALSEEQRPEKTLPDGWEARIGLNGRVYYHSLRSHTLQILPPPDSWGCAFDLPYGWELAMDYENKPYFVNHVLHQVTYEDPRTEDSGPDGVATNQLPSHPRRYTIKRDENLGFGFIAGSEKPVVVRSVTPDGPSQHLLLPGDQIIKIGEEQVASAPREKVITLIKESKTEVSLTVIQPPVVANSSFLKPSKKLLKGMNKHRVRFAENSEETREVMANGSSLLVSPNVLRVYLEEGQSRSFEFNSETTAGDIVALLCEELKINNNKLYSLLLKPGKSHTPPLKEHSSTRSSDDILISPWDLISKVLSNPSIKHHSCHFKLAFVAKDIHKLSREDPNSFNYLYQQCVNDVLAGDIYRDDLSLEDTLRLASLHILVVCLQQEETSSNQSSRKSTKKKAPFPPSKFSLKFVEKEFGLSRFLPAYVLDLVTSQSKEIRKTLQNCVKTSYNTYITNTKGSGGSKTSPPHSPSLNTSVESLEVILPQLRMQYIKSLSHFNLYSGRYFEATILAVNESDIVLLVGHHYGISQLINSKTKMVSVFANFSAVQLVEVAPQQPNSSKTNVRVEFQDIAPLVVSMPLHSALNFANMISGYCRVHDNNDMMLTLPIPESMAAPEYFGPHTVRVSFWNYPPNSESSSYHCDFSEPVDFSLIAEDIPESVRAMFQQSRVEDNYEDKMEESSPKEEVDGSASDVEPQTPVDEGVAMTATDLWPKSSASSDVSTSPSSGIGSVASNGAPQDGVVDKSSSKNQSTDQPRTSDASREEPWNELMVAVYDEAPSSDQEHDKSPSQDVAVNIQYINSSLRNETTQGKNEDNENNEADPHRKISESTSRGSGSIKNAGKSDESSADEKVPKPSKFSSFKPEKSSDDTSNNIPSTSRNVLDDVVSGDVISSGDFKATLGEKILTSAVPPAQLECDTPEVITSPLPVTDLARGHKSLKADKKKNRFSWGGSLPRSVSADPEEEKNKKSRTLFRNFFSTRRAYSMNDDKRKSTGSLGDEPGPKKKWSFFGIFRSSSSKKRSRFSIFRRKKKSHDLESPQFTQTAYSVFSGASTSKSDALKQAVSCDDVTMREKEVPPTKPRPVSFMTFQRPPSDDESDDSVPSTPEAKPRASVKEEPVRMEEPVKRRPSPKKVPPPEIPDIHKDSSDVDEISESSSVQQSPKSSTEEAVEVVNASSNDYECLADVAGSPTVTKIKRKAPPPPPLPPAREKEEKNEEMYEAPEEEPVYLDPDTSEQTKSNVERKQVDSAPEDDETFDEADDDLTTSAVETSKIEELIYESLDDENNDLKVNPALLEQIDKVQTDEDDAGSFASYKESNDDLTTQIFSVLNKSPEDDKTTEVSMKPRQSTSSWDENEEDTAAPQEDEVAKETGDKDEVSQDMVDSSKNVGHSSLEESDKKEVEATMDVGGEDKVAQNVVDSSKNDAFCFSEESEEEVSEPVIQKTIPLQEVASGFEKEPLSNAVENKQNGLKEEKNDPYQFFRSTMPQFYHEEDTPLAENDDEEVEFTPVDEDVNEQTKDSMVGHFASVVNRLLMSNSSNEEVAASEEDHDPDTEDVTSSNFVDKSDEKNQKVEENDLVSFEDATSLAVATKNANRSTHPVEIPVQSPLTDVSKIEPVIIAAKPSVPTIIPPPEEFNVSLKIENHSDVTPLSEPMHNHSSSTKTFQTVSPRSSFSSSNHVMGENDVVRHSDKSTSDTYHNLIAPRLFGQKREIKTFAKVRPPTSNRNSPRAPLITHVAYPGAAKNGGPQMAS